MQTREEARKLFLECDQIYTGQTTARPWTLLGVPRMQGRGVRMMRMRRSGRRNNSACCRHTSPRIQIPAAKYLLEDFAGWSTPSTNSEHKFQKGMSCQIQMHNKTGKFKCVEACK